MAWGLVGLYVSEQDEEVYQAAAPLAPNDQHADLKLVGKNHLEVGCFYELVPPNGDIHRVITSGDEPYDLAALAEQRYWVYLAPSL